MNTTAELQEFRPAARAIQEHQPSTMDLMQQAVASGNIDLVEKLMALQERNEKKLARMAFDAAVADAKAKIPVIKKNKHVGFSARDASKPRTDYDHEDFAEIARTVDPILGPLGLSYRYRIKQSDKITVICILAHRDGHFEETELSGPADTSGNKNPIQAIASTITLLQRYSLKAALGLAASKDDDGKAAGMDQSAPEKISEAQLDELLALAEKHGVDKMKYCRFREIDSFADILTTQFERAKQDFMVKRKVPA